MDSIKQYFWNILVWIDQGANVLLAPILNMIFKPGKFGDPDETLSSVFAKNVEVCRLCKFMCKLLHVFDKNHCEKVIEKDEGKKAL